MRKCQLFGIVKLGKEAIKIDICDKSVLPVYQWQHTLQDINFSNIYNHKYQIPNILSKMLQNIKVNMYKKENN